MRPLGDGLIYVFIENNVYTKKMNSEIDLPDL